VIPGNTSSQGKKPTTPTIGTASAGISQATVTFTESTYRGKNNAGTYKATSTPGSITGTCAAPCGSITVTGLSIGTAYTFTVELETPYGVKSDSSSSSNSVTPTAPPPSFPPSFGPSFPPSFGPPQCTPTEQCINDACSVCGVGSGPCGSQGFSCFPVRVQLNSDCSRTCHPGTQCAASFSPTPPGC